VKSLLRAAVLTAVTLALAAGSVRTATAQSLPATKVGVVNIGYVFTNYVKATAMKKELDEDLKPLKEQAEKLKNAMMEHKKWLEAPGNAKQNPQQAEVSQKALRDGARALEDLDLKARTLVGKKQETQLVQLYREIQAAVQSYAQQNGYHMILGYGDPPQLDPYTFANVNRRMTAMDMGTFVTMYVQNGLDISQEVLQRLNGGGVPIVPVGGSSAVGPPR
jgi:Skp family chaperone for outer membrane proteins